MYRSEMEPMLSPWWGLGQRPSETSAARYGVMFLFIRKKFIGS